MQRPANSEIHLERRSQRAESSLPRQGQYSSRERHRARRGGVYLQGTVPYPPPMLGFSLPNLQQSTGCKPIANIDSFTEDKLGAAELIEEQSTLGARIVKVTGIAHRPTSAPAAAQVRPSVSIVVRGANSLILDEAERSLHDALCVVRCLVKKRALIAGGGAPEVEVAQQLAARAQSRTGMEATCWRAFADALEVVPTTLAENAGLNSIRVVTELRNRHAQGQRNAGVSIRSGGVKTDITEENVLQPLLVSTSAIELAAETVKMLLRIDDIALSR